MLIKNNDVLDMLPNPTLSHNDHITKFVAERYGMRFSWSTRRIGQLPLYMIRDMDLDVVSTVRLVDYTKYKVFCLFPMKEMKVFTSIEQLRQFFQELNKGIK